MKLNAVSNGRPSCGANETLFTDLPNSPLKLVVQCQRVEANANKQQDNGQVNDQVYKFGCAVNYVAHTVCWKLTLIEEKVSGKKFNFL